MESPEKMTESTKELPRDFDFLVLGASGFTGKFVVKELTERVLSGQFGKNFKWVRITQVDHSFRFHPPSSLMCLTPFRSRLWQVDPNMLWTLSYRA